MRAKTVIFATGSHELPSTFENNDLPGIMLCSAIQKLIRLYGITPCKSAVIFGSSNFIYETALDLNPNLALAYARRGSIYYKLGDVQRATINWNLALRMDPEYDDVRNILKALHENRLKTTSFVRE